jgi:hypothetical protein
MRRKDWAIDAVAQTEVYPLKIHVMPIPYGTCIADLPQNKIPRSTTNQGKCTFIPENRFRGQMMEFVGLSKSDRIKSGSSKKIKLFLKEVAFGSRHGFGYLQQGALQD